MFHGVTHDTPALLPPPTQTSAFFSTWHTSQCSLQAEWQWLTGNKVDRNYGHNLEADSDNWRIDGKMHTKSKWFPWGRLEGNEVTHFKARVPCIWDLTSLAFSCLLLFSKFSSEERHLTVNARNSAYLQSRHMHPRLRPGKLLLTSLTLISMSALSHQKQVRFTSQDREALAII